MHLLHSALLFFFLIYFPYSILFLAILLHVYLCAKMGGLIAGHDFIPDGTVKAGLFGVQGACYDFFKSINREYNSISSKNKDGGRQEPQHVDGGWTTWYAFK